MSEEKYLILVSEGITDCSLLEVLLEKFLNFLRYRSKIQGRDDRNFPESFS